MSEQESVRDLEKAISEFLIQEEMINFRWITEGERSDDDFFATCLMIDGDVHSYVWGGNGIDEINRVSEKHGYLAEPINYIDIGFYNIAKWQAL
jgi:hypothetical protein